MVFNLLSTTYLSRAGQSDMQVLAICPCLQWQTSANLARIVSAAPTSELIFNATFDRFQFMALGWRAKREIERERESQKSREGRIREGGVVQTCRKCAPKLCKIASISCFTSEEGCAKLAKNLPRI